jgi:predicted TIM-barrel fold metal-dependent hydrolase
MTTPRPIDADNHYYEPLDAFTRHLPKEFRRRGVRAVQSGKRVELLIGDRVNRFIPNPTFDPIIVAGCLDLYFRGQTPGGTDRSKLFQVEPLRAEYRDRDARLAVTEAQGLDAVLLFPTLGCGVEQALRDDVPATMASLSAFNRWLEDDWGFCHKGRLIGVPMLSLANPDAAVAELESLLERGARMVHIRPAPVPTGSGGGRSLGDPLHDPVWARLAEAGIPAAFHLGDSGYNAFAGAWGAAATFEPFAGVDVLSRLVVSDRAIHDTLGSLVIDGVFHRHPTLKVASIENGSDWLHLLVKRLRKLANQTPQAFHEDPRDTLRRHVWVTPYLEDDLRALADLIGVERILFGSDWPHGEGTPQPLDFAEELSMFGAAEVRRIMRENVVELLGSAPR